jgi:hypothetical protein
MSRQSGVRNGISMTGFGAGLRRQEKREAMKC